MKRFLSLLGFVVLLLAALVTVDRGVRAARHIRRVYVTIDSDDAPR